MKKFIFLGCLAAVCMLGTRPVMAESLTVPVDAVTSDGIGSQIGTVTFVDVPGGMDIMVDLKGLAPGEHGMHIHQNPSCAPAQQDGKAVAALAAGGHWDPDNAKTHKGPANGGHKGDLPFVTANADGTAKQKLSVKGLSTAEIANHSLMIHAGGDNYSDNPPLGGGGGRIACGVIR